MSTTTHKIYIAILTLLVLITLVYLVYAGMGYYTTPLHERFYHTDHDNLKPSGIMGHGLGIIGSLAMIIGVSAYMIRKRSRALLRVGKLKHWLEFHIFLCTIGPIMVLFHTAFKFGGIVSVSFWSMVAVFASGVAGRFIYIQIPRSIEGRALTLNEIRDLKTNLSAMLHEEYNLDEESYKSIIATTKLDQEDVRQKPLKGLGSQYMEDRKALKTVKKILKSTSLTHKERKSVLKIVNDELALERRIGRLKTMQNLFKYWHVAHLPFALVMLIIMLIHIIVTITFGYRWIF
ncbi:MAG TPA: hypothetical protein P5514_06175 [Bacteroidales bacterium]|nr:hypothetical protein [Bacteroidales bacterium]